MKLVIIESPYAGNVLRNKRYLQACIRDCIRRGESPYASHQMLTEALDDNDPEQRKLGIEAGLAWGQARIAGYPIPHVFYVDLGWSTGMRGASDVCEQESRPAEIRGLPSSDPFFAT